MSFLPALMLSGFIFDLHSVPAVVRGISRVLPPTYYVEALQTLFLAGNVAGLIIKDCAVLSPWPPSCCSSHARSTRARSSHERDAASHRRS